MTEDLNQMIRAGVVKADNSEEYWFASYSAEDSSYCVYFCVRYSEGYGYATDMVLCNVYDEAYSRYADFIRSLGVRPVLTLQSGVLEGAKGTGEKTNPIVILQNN